MTAITRAPGVRKVHAELNRQGNRVARCTVRRLMKRAGLRGITRTKGPRTTVAAPGPDTRPDLVERSFTADAPNQLWVADITYVRTFTGWVCAAFVIDVFSRRVVGWQVSRSLRTDLALDALEMAVWNREHVGRRIDGLVHHSDRLNSPSTSRCATPNAWPGPGRWPRSAPPGTPTTTPWPRRSTRCSRPSWSAGRRPWKGIDNLELGVAEYVDWFNHRQLHGEIGLVPPSELEADFYQQGSASAETEALVPSL